MLVQSWPCPLGRRWGWNRAYAKSNAHTSRRQKILAPFPKRISAISVSASSASPSKPRSHRRLPSSIPTLIRITTKIGDMDSPTPDKNLVPPSPVGTQVRHTTAVYPPQSLLCNVNNNSSHVRSSVNTVRALGSGSEERQRGLLSMGWEWR